jgi:hypothetical protein
MNTNCIHFATLLLPPEAGRVIRVERACVEEENEKWLPSPNPLRK